MSGELLSLSLPDLALVYGMVLVVAGLSRLQRANQARTILWAGARMIVQLLLLGYLLQLIFDLRHPLAVLAVLLVMGVFASQTVTSRVEGRMPGLPRIVGSSLLLGCGLATFLFCHLIVGLTPWYEPRYLIPLAGMIVGNSMTAASLAAERLAGEIRERRTEIEAVLCLGGTSRQAVESAVRQAFRAALIPSVNAMAAMGVVFIPGMMTGQILSGTDPLLAVRYQIGIMGTITFSVGVTTALILWQGVRSFFTPAHQLRLPE